jgi:hypothetical protein
MDLKMSNYDYKLFLLIHGAFRKADALVMEFLNRTATAAGIDPKTHRFNIETRCFEPIPEAPPPATVE